MQYCFIFLFIFFSFCIFVVFCNEEIESKFDRMVVAWLDQFQLGYLLLTEPRWNGGMMRFLWDFLD
jgi:hypothetical protein